MGDRMGDIDRVSQLLGSMQSDITHIKRVSDQTARQVNTLNGNVTENTESTKSAHKRIDAVEPLAAELNNWKNRSMGALIGVSSVSGFVGGLVGAILKFFSH